MGNVLAGGSIHAEGNLHYEQHPQPLLSESGRGGAGLGAASCRSIAKGGYHVLISGRTLEKVERVAQTIRQTGGSAEAAVTDANKRARYYSPV